MDASEVEIKLRLDPQDVEKFASLDILHSEKEKRQRFRTVYFDDRRRRLARNGFELRVRTMGESHVQTIKSGLGLTRGGWEAPLEGDAPSRPAARKTPARKLLRKGHDLEPVFVVDVERRSWTLARVGSTAEVSLDAGEIVNGEHKQPIAVVEIELKKGAPELIFDLAQKAIHRCDAPPSFVDKALRGRRLEQGLIDCAESSFDLQLESGLTAMDAVARIFEACLQQVSVNEEVLRRHPGSVEATHQLRVAIRRLRAALSLFKPRLESEALDQLKQELAWISDLLGDGRDHNVFVTSSIEAVRRLHPDVSGLEQLHDHSEALRKSAGQRLDEALRTERFSRLLLDLVEFSHAGAWRDDDHPKRARTRNKRFEKFAARELDRRLKSVPCKKNREIIEGDHELERHRLRIKAKKLRYMAEFLKSMAPPQRFGQTVKALQSVQKALGVVHDTVIAEQIASKLLARENKADLAFAANLVCQELAPPPDCLNIASAAHQKLRRSIPFWRGL